MSEALFQRWVCDDVVEGVGSEQVVTLSTVVYPLPLLARNPRYASHPIMRAFAARAPAPAPGATGGGSSGSGQETGPGGAHLAAEDRGGAGLGPGQRGVEALETLLTRVVLKPKRELRERAMAVAGRVREKAREWGRRRESRAAGRGLPPPPVRVVGIHARTYFIKAVSTDTVRVDGDDQVLHSFRRRGAQNSRALFVMGVRGWVYDQLPNERRLEEPTADAHLPRLSLVDAANIRPSLTAQTSRTRHKQSDLLRSCFVFGLLCRSESPPPGATTTPTCPRPLTIFVETLRKAGTQPTAFRRLRASRRRGRARRRRPRHLFFRRNGRGEYPSRRTEGTLQ